MTRILAFVRPLWCRHEWVAATAGYVHLVNRKTGAPAGWVKVTVFGCPKCNKPRLTFTDRRAEGDPE